MAHEKAEKIEGDAGRVYLYETRKLGFGSRGSLASHVSELVAEGGMLIWSPFGGWYVTLATSGSPATARKVETMHATYRLAALEAVRARREAIADGLRLTYDLPARPDYSEPCSECGTKDNPAGGEGWDGMCSTCADKADAAAQVQP